MIKSICFYIVVVIMFLLYSFAIIPLGIRNLAHWVCCWMDRWFDLVGQWVGIDTSSLPLPKSSDNDVDELPPGFTWLPKPKLFGRYNLRKN